MQSFSRKGLILQNSRPFNWHCPGLLFYMCRLWRELDIGAALASTLSEHWAPDRQGSQGLADGVTVSCGTWGGTDEELGDSVGLVSALVTGKSAAAAFKAAEVREPAVTFCALLKFQACPLSSTQWPWCSHSCCLQTWSVKVFAHTFSISSRSDMCWPTTTHYPSSMERWLHSVNDFSLYLTSSRLMVIYLKVLNRLVSGASLALFENLECLRISLEISCI